MKKVEPARVDSEDLSDFMKVMEAGMGRTAETQQTTQEQVNRVNVDPDKMKNGVAQLVLTVVKLIHELLEKQAVRRIDAESLTDDEIEKVGLTLMRQAEELVKLQKLFGFKDEDLNIDLGPLGKLL
ncbi:gas vesicle protein K [Desulforhopalus vacuolatus]|uniref:gas vesicle protein GvpK n=1 Tax=Desulforhopalus vacuolatus TaxID=40414 RepID=UPI0019653687|nr:gas vesicle protein K [Desulforhopalus vacuolatus]